MEAGIEDTCVVGDPCETECFTCISSYLAFFNSDEQLGDTRNADGGRGPRKGGTCLREARVARSEFIEVQEGIIQLRVMCG